MGSQKSFAYSKALISCFPPRPLCLCVGYCRTSLRSRKLASDDISLDLRRALVDLQHLRIAEQFLYRVLGTVAHATEDLHRLARRPHRTIRSEGLRICSLQSVTTTCVQQPGGLMDKKARR